MNKIHCVPVGPVDDDLMNIAGRYIGGMFGFGVDVHQALPVPDYALDEARGQYSSTLILRNLAPACPAEAVRFLAITTLDLFIPMMTFVYGQAQLSGKAAIVSLARLAPEFYGLPRGKELMVRRVRKEIAHELGHTFGLVHCAERSCLMSLSTEIMQIDMKSQDFCPTCWIILQENLKILKQMN